MAVENFFIGLGKMLDGTAFGRIILKVNFTPMLKTTCLLSHKLPIVTPFNI
jgi:hypothetical protein